MQDAYSLRCSPAVHGAARDTVGPRDLVADRELASAIDNPVVLPDGRVESNGNFHGAPVAAVLDFLAISVADVAGISERRTDRMLDAARSHGLPPFLAHEVGVDSGHMIAQYTQAGIVSELKRLAVPASVDSIPSSAMQEDHVSLGWHAGRKLRRAVDGLRRVLAIEILTAAQGSGPPGAAAARPGDRRGAATSSGPGSPGPGPDRHLGPEIDAVVDLLAGRCDHRSRRGAGAIHPHSTGEPMTPPHCRGPARTAAPACPARARCAPPAGPRSPRKAGPPRPRCGCCATTSIPTSPRIRTTWSSTAAPARPPATGPASTPSAAP